MDRRRVRSICTSRFSFYHRNMILIVGIVLAVAATATLSFFQFSRSQKIRSPQVRSTRSSCHIPAIFNFGDSNSDTGSSSAAFARVRPPNGITFFGKPSGRVSDGRLIIDFIGNYPLTSWINHCTIILNQRLSRFYLRFSCSILRLSS